jgi:hypothetical protein
MLLFCIRTASLYIIVNTFLYFVEIPVWTRYRPWWGRISQGYPTCDVLPLAFVLALTILNKHLNINIIKRVIYSTVTTLGIALIASGTGIVLVSITMIAALFVCVFDSYSFVLKKNLLYFILTIVIAITSGITVLKIFDINLYNSLYFAMESRISNLIGKEHEMNTMAIRSKQIEVMDEMYLKQAENKIFGVGFGLVDYSRKENHNSKYIYVENQYTLNKITGGIISNTFYILFICIFILKSLNKKYIELSDKILNIICLIFFAASSFTVVPLGVYSIILSFSIIFERK